MKVKLPPGILRPLPNAEAANKVPACPALLLERPELSYNA